MISNDWQNQVFEKKINSTDLGQIYQNQVQN